MLFRSCCWIFTEPVAKKGRNSGKIFNQEELGHKNLGGRAKSHLVTVPAVGKVSKAKGKESDVVVKKLKTSCQPRKVVELYQSLTDAQRNDVSEIGFGGLGKLLVKHNPAYIVSFLFGNFQFRSHVQEFEGKSYQVTADDVHDVFMLPRHIGHDVPLVTPDEYVVRAKWTKKWAEEGWTVPTPDKEDIKLSDVGRRISQLRDGGDDFKRLFVVYVCGHFLDPTPQGTYIDKRLLVALDDVSRIRSYDWCSLVMDKIGQSARSFAMTDYCSVNSCVWVLIFCYFHRFNYKGRDEPSSIPLCGHWTDERVKSRVNRERVDGFGLSPLSTLYPITKAKRDKGPTFYVEPRADDGFLKYPLREGVVRSIV